MPKRPAGAGVRLRLGGVLDPRDLDEAADNRLHLPLPVPPRVLNGEERGHLPRELLPLRLVVDVREADALDARVAAGGVDRVADHLQVDEQFLGRLRIKPDVPGRLVVEDLDRPGRIGLLLEESDRVDVLAPRVPAVRRPDERDPRGREPGDAGRVALDHLRPLGRGGDAPPARLQERVPERERLLDVAEGLLDFEVGAGGGEEVLPDPQVLGERVLARLQVVLEDPGRLAATDLRAGLRLLLPEDVLVGPATLTAPVLAGVELPDRGDREEADLAPVDRATEAGLPVAAEGRGGTRGGPGRGRLLGLVRGHEGSFIAELFGGCQRRSRRP